MGSGRVGSVFVVLRRAAAPRSEGSPRPSHPSRVRAPRRASTHPPAPGAGGGGEASAMLAQDLSLWCSNLAWAAGQSVKTGLLQPLASSGVPGILAPTAGFPRVAGWLAGWLARPGPGFPARLPEG